MDDIGQLVDFRKGNAESLPFEDDAFDITMSFTLLEEVDAGKAIAEMIRVTKVGGRVLAIVRALDMPWLFCFPLAKEIITKIENRGSGNEGNGCSSRSLYSRFLRAGLREVEMMPLLVPFDDPNGGVERLVQGNVRSFLDSREFAQWSNAVDLSVADGTFLFCWPHHTAIGTKQ